MAQEFSTRRSNAIRAGLIETVEDTARTKLVGRSSNRWIPGVAILVVGLVTGGAASAAAVTALQPRAPQSATATTIPAPPGVVPGQPIISLLGPVTSFAVNSSRTLQLPAAPTGATHVRVSVTCLTEGRTTFGFDSHGNNPELRCSQSDINPDQPRPTFQDLAIPTRTDFYITVDPRAKALVTFQYLNYVNTALGTNANGESFGSAGFGAEPDLVLVDGIESNGKLIEGYARQKDLNAFGPDWPNQPTSPTEAIQWQEDRAARYPNGWDIPVYKSDGQTQIGTFHISN